MRANREKVIAWVGLSEGGFVDHPKDPGGRTNRGITQSTYNAWLKSQGRPSKDVLHITKGEAETIIGIQYLDAVRFDDLPPGLDYSVADFAVNSGPARAAKELQRLVGLTGAQVDGVIGAKTLAAVARADLVTLIGQYNDRRLAFLKSLKTWATFGRGWGARVATVRQRSLELARGKAMSVSNGSPPPETPKATEDQIRTTSMLGKVLEDPMAVVPAVGTIITPWVNSSGPMAWALAALVLIAGAYVAIRALKRST